jgi:hypothetical protein
MAIGAIPTIPLYRVQSNPDARFQRFGLNDSQLFGKPMADFTVPAVRPAQVPRTQPRPEEAPVRSQPIVTAKPQESPATAVSYSSRSTSQPGTTAVPGAFVDTKA